MADASFDVVVIGGGHQGLTIANYMVRNGYTVGLFEQRRELGGGGCTEPRPASGFRSNPCAHIIGLWSSPVNQDFKLHERGLNYIFSEVQTSVVFPDDRCIVSYRAEHWDRETGDTIPDMEQIKRTIGEIERISPRDAEYLWKIEPQMWEWGMAASQILWNPPSLPGEPDPLEALLSNPESGIDPRYQSMTAAEIICSMFESPELRTWALRVLNSSAALYPDDILPLPILLYTIPLELLGFGGCCIEGGAHNAVHALQRALSEEGGKFFVGADVDLVLVENGRARGVRLSDGTEVEAKQMVITSIEVGQTVNRHLRDVEIGPDIRRKVNNLRWDRGGLIWGNIAFHELPRYRAQAWNPDCGKARQVYLVEADVDYICREYHHSHENLRPGNWPDKMYFWEATDSKFDASYAPRGKHISILEFAAPPASRLTEEEWIQIKREAPEQFLRYWQRFAPNMTWDNIIATIVDTPYDTQRRSDNFVDGSWVILPLIPSQWGVMRPIPELAQYQVPGIENLWMASGSCHTSVAMLACASYNCYKRMAQKYNLWKPWEGRLY